MSLPARAGGLCGRSAAEARRRGFSRQRVGIQKGRRTMIFRSPYADITIPETPLTPLLLRHAERLADKPALIDDTTKRAYTYGELATTVRNLAGNLARRGFQPGDIFAICAPNSPEYAI